MAVRWEIILKFMDEKILILYKFFQKITRSKIFPIPFIRSLALISKQRQDKKRKELRKKCGKANELWLKRFNGSMSTEKTKLPLKVM